MSNKLCDECVEKLVDTINKLLAEKEFHCGWNEKIDSAIVRILEENIDKPELLFIAEEKIYYFSEVHRRKKHYKTDIYWKKFVIDLCWVIYH